VTRGRRGSLQVSSKLRKEKKTFLQRIEGLEPKTGKRGSRTLYSDSEISPLWEGGREKTACPPAKLKPQNEGAVGKERDKDNPFGFINFFTPLPRQRTLAAVGERARRHSDREAEPPAKADPIRDTGRGPIKEVIFLQS